MSTTTIQQAIAYGIGEGAMVADATMLSYCLRWANNSCREIFLRYRFKNLRTRSIFRTTHGQQTYQAPTDFSGFLTLKDESNDQIVAQITPEELQRLQSQTLVSDEDVTVSSAVAVDLDNTAIQQYSETVTNTAGTTTYVRDTDYTMDYVAGTITMLAGGSLVTATEYHISYLYLPEGKPTHFCMEFDINTNLYLFRMYPTPDATYIGSMLYLAMPSVLSGSVNPMWDQFEFCLERGGIYYGAVETVLDPQKRMEFKQHYENSIQALIQLDLELVPKRNTIPMIMRKSDYK
uniref:Uncharacterized protein n=1 Tax=viral metagenome TaxID=1070528 RepID=A0A6H1Z5Q7_9ZZZZ